MTDIDDGNVIDFLRVFNSVGGKITKQMIAELCPDPPPWIPKRSICAQMKGGFYGEKVVYRLTKEAEKKLEKFPGYIPCGKQREHLKYGHSVPPDGPIHEWIKIYINHARAKWSGEIDGGETRQFIDWLFEYMTDDARRWQWLCGYEIHEEARQIVRQAFGLPRFQPTKPNTQKV